MKNVKRASCSRWPLPIAMSTGTSRRACRGGGGPTTPRPESASCKSNIDDETPQDIFKTPKGMCADCAASVTFRATRTWCASPIHDLRATCVVSAQRDRPRSTVVVFHPPLRTQESRTHTHARTHARTHAHDPLISLIDGSHMELHTSRRPNALSLLSLRCNDGGACSRVAALPPQKSFFTPRSWQISRCKRMFSHAP